MSFIVVLIKKNQSNNDPERIPKDPEELEILEQLINRMQHLKLHKICPNLREFEELNPR